MTEYIFVISCGFWSCDTGRVTAAAATTTIMYICQGQIWKHSVQLKTIHGVKEDYDFTLHINDIIIPKFGNVYNCTFCASPKFRRKGFSWQHRTRESSLSNTMS